MNKKTIVMSFCFVAQISMILSVAKGETRKSLETDLYRQRQSPVPRDQRESPSLDVLLHSEKYMPQKMGRSAFRIRKTSNEYAIDQTGKDFSIVRIKLFPVTVKRGSRDHYPVLDPKLTHLVQVAHPSGLKLIIRDKEYSGKKISFNFKDEMGIQIYKEINDVEPSFKIPLQTIMIIPNNNEGTTVSWNALQYKLNLKNKAEVQVPAMESKVYQGAFKVINLKEWSLINYVDLEEYVTSVVPAEAVPSWPMAVLEAQSIAARTYAVRQMMQALVQGDEYDMLPTQADQQYCGLSIEAGGPNIAKAVINTKHKIIRYNNTVANAMYHSNSGGLTRSSAELGRNSKELYLQTVADPDGVRDAKKLGINSDRSLSIAAVQKVFASWCKENPKRNGCDQKSNVAQMLVTQRTASQRLVTFTLELQNQYRVDLHMNNPEERERLGEILPKIIIENNQFDLLPPVGGLQRLTYYGSGHGFGMSQWGAYLLAETKKFTSEQILKYYYKDIQIFDATKLLKTPEGGAGPVLTSL